MAERAAVPIDDDTTAGACNADIDRWLSALCPFDDDTTAGACNALTTIQRDDDDWREGGCGRPTMAERAAVPFTIARAIGVMHRVDT